MEREKLVQSKKHLESALVVTGMMVLAGLTILVHLIGKIL